MQWIQFTKFHNKERKERIAIPVSQILSVHDDGTNTGSVIVRQEEHGTVNTHVEDDFDAIFRQLNSD